MENLETSTPDNTTENISLEGNNDIILKMDDLRATLLTLEYIGDRGVFKTFNVIKQVTEVYERFKKFFDFVDNPANYTGIDAATLALNITDVANALAIIDYGANEGAYRGWQTINDVIIVRNKLQAFSEAAVQHQQSLETSSDSNSNSSQETI